MDDRKRTENEHSKAWWIGLTLVSILLCASAGAMPISVGQDLLLPDPDGIESDGNDQTSIETAESFAVVSAFGVETIRWWGVYDPRVATDDFSISILGEDSSGLPDNGNVVYQASAVTPVRTSTGEFDGADGEIFEYRFDVPVADAFDLVVGDYWLAIVNGTLVQGIDTNWFWTQGIAGDGINAFRDTSIGPTWSLAQSFDLAFEVSGTGLASVPLPPVWLLMLGPGLLMAARARQ